MDGENCRADAGAGKVGVSPSPWLPSLGLRIAGREIDPGESWPQQPLEGGFRIGEYDIGPCMAEWPMGYVYEGCRVGENVALTLIVGAEYAGESDGSAVVLREVFQRYERVDDRTHVLRLHHPSAPVMANNVTYVVLAAESISATFADWLELARGRAGEAASEGVELIRQASLGVAAFAAHGLAVDNLLPHNLVLVAPGDPGSKEVSTADRPAEAALPRVKVCEIPVRALGAAAASAYNWRLPAALYGAPDRMICAGDAPDERACVYSVGVMLLEVLRGAPPFRGTAAEVSLAHFISEPPGVPAHAPQWLGALLHRCMARQRGLRPAKLRHLARLLETGPLEAEAHGRAMAVGSELALEEFLKAWADGCFHLDATQRLEVLRSRRVAREKAEQEQRDAMRRRDEANRCLVDAARRGRLADLLAALRAGGDVRWRSPEGTTPLWEAVGSESVECVAALLENGADAREVDEKGNTLFHSWRLKGLEVAKLLVAYGANPNRPNDAGIVPVAWKFILSCVKGAAALLEVGVSVDGIYREPLADVVRILTFQSEWLPLLIRYGLDVNHRWPNGDALLHGAVRRNKPELAKTLVKAGANLKAGNCIGWTALHVAACEGRSEVLRVLLLLGADRDARDTNGWTPVMVAASEGAMEVLGILLDNHANLDERSKDGVTALMIAAGNGQPDAARELIRRGASTRLRANLGYTAFAFGVLKGHTEIVEFFLDRGVDLSERLQDGRTALELAESQLARDQKNPKREEVVRLIRAKAAAEAKASVPVEPGFRITYSRSSEQSQLIHSYHDPCFDVQYKLGEGVRVAYKNLLVGPLAVSGEVGASSLPAWTPAANSSSGFRLVQGRGEAGRSGSGPAAVPQGLGASWPAQVAVPATSIFGASNIYLHDVGLVPVTVGGSDRRRRQECRFIAGQ